METKERTVEEKNMSIGICCECHQWEMESTNRVAY